MLSKFDIQRELGKEICVFPLDLDNIKENSINLCAGNYAWSMATRKVFYSEKERDKNRKFSLTEDTEHCMSLMVEKGRSAVFKDNNGEQYILVLPLSTTLIETKEVLAVSAKIGGTYHSKVGLVSKGSGHIGTMVGPNYSGESLIAFHNVSNELLVLSVGESFVSVVFHYLKTPFTYANPTTSGHTDKFSSLGLEVNERELAELNQDWKKKFEEVQKRMRQTEAFQDLQRELKDLKRKRFKQYFCKRNIIICVVTLAAFVLLYYLAAYIDQKRGVSIWVDRYWNVGFSGFFVTALAAAISALKNRR